MVQHLASDSEGHFVLYSKPGCHLCEGLAEKLEQIAEVASKLEIRDITTRSDWQARYSLEIPVLCWLQNDREHPLPRLSPRASIAAVRSVVMPYVRPDR
ncbi:MAG: glutaredoxin family protein [Cyanobacteria bacterium J06642_2]